MKSLTSKFSVNSEEKLKKLMSRLTAAEGVVSLNKETIQPPHRNTFQRFNDWMCNAPKQQPEVLFSFQADSAILIDGRYDPEGIAEQIMRMLPAGEAASFTEIDFECGETRILGIERGRITKTNLPVYSYRPTQL